MTSWWILDLLGTSGFFMLISLSGDIVSTQGLTVTASGPLAWSSQGWKRPVVPCVLSMSDSRETSWGLGMEKMYCSYKKSMERGEARRDCCDLDESLKFPGWQ